ncbi:MAG: xanthine dehydrogenase small subunit [Rhizobiaceae bacterium]
MTENATNFVLNGVKSQAFCRPDMTVLNWLRNERRLTGTKEGCAEGDCGACSILISKCDKSGFLSANACIMAIGQLAGRSVITVEGLSQNGSQPIQRAMAENGSSQCGFCTPGIVVSLAGLLSANTNPDDEEIHDALAGNLCRCTGYKPIVEAARKVALTPVALDGFTGDPVSEADVISSNGSAFHRPQTLTDLFALRQQFPDAQLLAGGTDIGVALAEHAVEWPVTIWTGAVKALREIHEDASIWRFGSAVTWTEILEKTADALPSLATLLRRFGSTQIRNMGTIGGNIGTASPIGDGPPPLIALGASITLTSASGERTMALEDFFLDYRKTELRPDEIIKSISVPKPVEGQHFRVWKISKRYDQDISTVCGAFNFIIANGKITSARVAFGGMAAIPRRSMEAEAALTGMDIKSGDFAKVADAIRATFKPLSDWRGTAEYRSLVAGNLALRLGAELNGETVEVMELEGAQ